MILIRHLLLLALACFACSAKPAAADPAWKNELTTPKPGEWPAVPPSALDFEVSWKGMLNAGDLRIEFAPKGVQKTGRLVVRSSAASSGPASALFPYQSHFWSELDPATLQPRYFHAVETDRREKVTTEVRHLQGRVEFSEITEPLKKAKATNHSGVFRFTPVYDIFSAMLHVRSQRLAPEDRIHLVVHPFDNPYLLRVEVLDREAHLGRPAIHLSVSMAKIDRETLELRPYRKMRRAAHLWLSDDADRIPLELRAAIFIGDIRATLSGFRKFRP